MKMKHHGEIIAIAFLLTLLLGAAGAQASNNQILLDNLDSAIQSFWESGGRFEHADGNTYVGFPMVKTVDDPSKPMWGVDDSVAANQPLVSIMEPGIPGAGLAFLRAYENTGNKLYLEYAIEAGKTLLSIQKDLETNPKDGSQKPQLESGGLIDYAFIIPDNPETRSNAKIQNEIGHWALPKIKTPKEQGDIDFAGLLSREDAWVAFDDSISTKAAIFLLELYDSTKDLDFSSGVVDPLEGIDRTDFLDGATKFFNLVEAYRNDFEIRASYFDITVGWSGKSGLHPFKAYISSLPPEHPLKNGQAFKPYANGGIPLMAGSKSRLVTGGQGYGSLVAGYLLHKPINDSTISNLLPFLWRYYEVTGNSSALNNLNLQLNWLTDVFQEYGNRSWCQQYHALDDKCTPARPFEPPAFAVRESLELIRRMGFIEKKMEETGTTSDNIRKALEDSLYYIDRVITYDERPDPKGAGNIFTFYTTGSYDTTTTPSGNATINPNDPVFSCNYYYPEEPYLCLYGFAGFNYYLIDEEANGEFVTPIPSYGLQDHGDGYIYKFMISDACLDSTSPANYSGCLDLSKPYAETRGYWDIEGIAWGYGVNKGIDAYLRDYAPDAQTGFWKEDYDLSGVNRKVISTNTFRSNVYGIAKFLGKNKTGITDSDSDGLLDTEETAIGTDVFYPDSDKDGIRDGEDPNPLNFCNSNGTCEPELGESAETCAADCTNTAITECVDNEKLLGYISQWKRGEISMLALMQKIRQRNTGDGCSTPA